MELSLELLNNLIQLGINPTSLSENEKKFLSQIHIAFEEFKIKNASILRDLSRNRLSIISVSEQVGCSRQILYRNPTLLIYLNWCIKEADFIYSKSDSANLVSKEKYNRLKNENSNLLTNIVDHALKDVEIVRLVNENKELRKRVQNLISKYEVTNKELSELKRSKKS